MSAAETPATAKIHPLTPAQLKPGLTVAIRVARFLTHFFLVVGFFSLFVSAASESAGPFLVCVGGFVLSYFSWAGLVLFGFMNFSLGVMLSFVMAWGACLGMLMSATPPLMFLGGAGLLVMAFLAIAPISGHDPTTKIPDPPKPLPPPPPPPPEPPPIPDTPLVRAIRLARFSTHLFLVCGFFSLFIAAGSRSPWPIVICGIGFLVSYFGWVGIVLFGCMNFSLSALMGFVVLLGACMGMLMSGEVALAVLGGFGLLLMMFLAVIPISGKDPTSKPQPRGLRPSVGEVLNRPVG